MKTLSGRYLMICAGAALVAASVTPVSAATSPARIVRYLLPTIKLLDESGAVVKTVEAGKLPVNADGTIYDDELGTYSLRYENKTYWVKQGQVQADKRACPDNYALVALPKGQINAGPNAGANEPAYQCLPK